MKELQKQIRDRLAELTGLTSAYLLQEFPQEGWLTTDQETFHYFKEQALKRRQSAPKGENLLSSPPKPPITPQFNRSAAVEDSKSEQDLPSSVAESQVKAPPPAKTLLEPLQEPVVPANKTEPPSPAAPQIVQKFELEPLKERAADDLKDIRSIIAEHCPTVSIIDEIPDDKLAGEICNRWKGEQKQRAEFQVILLSFNDTAPQQTFLQNVTRAINERLGSASLMAAEQIEREKRWDALLASPSLKLIVAQEYSIHQLPEMMRHYRESGKATERFLGNIPLLLLGDISHYLREPHLKAALWKALCKTFGK